MPKPWTVEDKVAEAQHRFYDDLHYGGGPNVREPHRVQNQLSALVWLLQEMFPEEYKRASAARDEDARKSYAQQRAEQDLVNEKARKRREAKGNPAAERQAPR